MKIKTEEIRGFLNLNEQDLERLSVEQLRLLLGMCHYVARLTQREINARLGEFSVGRKQSRL